ncbi:Armadillo-type fold [Phytophthora cactorum]|nr:Armadillo-type fold [Phytophthora cactorum]
MNSFRQVMAWWNQPTKENAAHAIDIHASNGDIACAEIAQRGGITDLIEVLRGGTDLQKQNVMSVFKRLACCDDIRVEIASKGAIPLLVGIYIPRETAAHARSNLACNVSICASITGKGNVKERIDLLHSGLIYRRKMLLQRWQMLHVWMRPLLILYAKAALAHLLSFFEPGQTTQKNSQLVR